MAREIPIQNGRLGTDLDANGHSIKNLPAGFPSSKQDVIVDLPTIRAGAAAGATAVQPSALSGYVNAASYDTQAKKILLKNGTTTVAEVDATDFIKDGMVSGVEITGGNLVITFNTDSGKEPISIALTSIFNPSNYYDKTATDDLLSGKVPTTRKVNNKALSANVTLTASDVGAVKTNYGSASNLTVSFLSIAGSANASCDLLILSTQTFPPSQEKRLILRNELNQSAITETSYYDGRIVRDGKTISLPSVAGTLALLSDIAVKSVKLNGTALTPDANGAVDIVLTTDDLDYASGGGSMQLTLALDTIFSTIGDLAPLASPAFTGTPTAPNLTDQSADGQVANKKYVDDKVAGVSVTPLSGQTFDFATMQGIFAGVKACIEALGGSVTNFPSAN